VQNGPGPFRFFGKTPPAARAPANFPRGNKLAAPGLQKLKNFALVRVHKSKLAKNEGEVEPLNIGALSL
jgi:hypothetical protein